MRASWLNDLRKPAPRNRPGRPSPPRPRRRALALEALEDRTVPAVVTIDTTNLVISGAGFPGTVYGVPYHATVSGGVAVFTIDGDLNVPAGDRLVGVGFRPAELLVGNNTTIAAGASIDFSAPSSQSRR